MGSHKVKKTIPLGSVDAQHKLPISTRFELWHDPKPMGETVYHAALFFL